MKSAFRNSYLTLSSRYYSQSQPNPPSFIFFPLPTIAASVSSLPIPRVETLRSHFGTLCFGSMAGCESHAQSSFLEKQFEDFRLQLAESGNLRDQIRNLAMEIESTARLMHANLLLVHQSRPTPEVLDKSKVQIGGLRELYCRLGEVVRGCPGQYYRYHGDWKSETQTVVSLLALLHWLETGNLLLHTDAQEQLGLNDSEFFLDVDDYLVGLCFMSNELPRYVVNQVTAGDYDSPSKVLKFMKELHESFRMLNLRNDFLRKKFDGMKYDLRKVEEVHYDVKIRGLATNDSNGDQTAQKQS